MSIIELLRFLKRGGGCGRFWNVGAERSKVLLCYDEINRNEQYVTVKKRRRNRQKQPSFAIFLPFLSGLDIFGSFLIFLLKSADF